MTRVLERGHISCAAVTYSPESEWPITKETQGSCPTQQGSCPQQEAHCSLLFTGITAIQGSVHNSHVGTMTYSKEHKCFKPPYTRWAPTQCSGTGCQGNFNLYESFMATMERTSPHDLKELGGGSNARRLHADRSKKQTSK